MTFPSDSGNVLCYRYGLYNFDLLSIPVNQSLVVPGLWLASTMTEEGTRSLPWLAICVNLVACITGPGRLSAAIKPEASNTKTLL